MSIILALRTGVAAVLMAACLVAAYQSVRFFLSEVYAYQAKRYEKHWEGKGQIPRPEQWGIAQSRAKRALALNDGNPDHWLRAARINEWYAYSPRPDLQLLPALHDEAASLIERAILLRPSYGAGFSARAMLAARRWQTDSQLANDLYTTMRFSPWERAAQIQAVSAAFYAWPILEQQGRAAVADWVEDALENKPRRGNALIRVAKEMQRIDVLCNSFQRREMDASSIPACEATVR